MPERIGFIGLGIMGRPMARNLLDAGFPLTVHSRSDPPVEEVVAAGASRAGSSGEAAAASDIVITMLPDTPKVREVLLGEGGVVGSARPGSLVIDMSTIDPGATREMSATLAERDIRMIDAPVSGGERAAIDGALSIMVGGDDVDVARALPLLQTMGATIVHVGRSGAGQICKACNQLVVGATIEAVAEALTLAERSGTDPAKVREALLGGFAASKVLEVHGRRMLDGDFRPGFRTVLHAKDARIVLEAAGETGTPTPSFKVVAQQLSALVDAGGGDLDHSALITLLRDD